MLEFEDHTYGTYVLKDEIFKGMISKVKGGYAFFPKDKFRFETFPTIQDVKDSLEYSDLD